MSLGVPNESEFESFNQKYERLKNDIEKIIMSKGSDNYLKNDKHFIRIKETFSKGMTLSSYGKFLECVGVVGDILVDLSISNDLGGGVILEKYHDIINGILDLVVIYVEYQLDESDNNSLLKFLYFEIVNQLNLVMESLRKRNKDNEKYFIENSMFHKSIISKLFHIILEFNLEIGSFLTLADIYKLISFFWDAQNQFKLFAKPLQFLDEFFGGPCVIDDKIKLLSQASSQDIQHYISTFVSLKNFKDDCNGESIFTNAKSFDVLHGLIYKAIDCYFSSYLSQDVERIKGLSAENEKKREIELFQANIKRTIELKDCLGKNQISALAKTLHTQMQSNAVLFQYSIVTQLLYAFSNQNQSETVSTSRAKAGKIIYETAFFENMRKIEKTRGPVSEKELKELGADLSIQHEGSSLFEFSR